MIGVDQIEFSDDGTALVVFWPNEDDEQLAVYRVADRPCGTCDGSGEQDWIIDNGGRPGNYPTPCPGCGGSGRHCFDIEVVVPEGRGDMFPDPGWFRTLTVSVVPGAIEGLTVKNLAVWSAQYLPSAAAPGQWAVKLAVHA